MEKEYKMKANEIKDVLKWQGADGCLATDRITVDGCRVGYMYREEPDNEFDSGWRFFEGNEDENYINDLSHTGIYKLNTICNYDNDIIPLLKSPFNTAFSRNENGDFEKELLYKEES